MATTYQKSTKHDVYPNLTVYDGYDESSLFGWKVNANEGFVFYDTARIDTELDPETDEEIPVTYYFTVTYLPLGTDWENFSLVAVPKDNVDEKYII